MPRTNKKEQPVQTKHFGFFIDEKAKNRKNIEKHM